MDLEIFLRSKGIDSKALRVAMPAVWEKWTQMATQCGPDAFDQWAKFQFNPLRRQFPMPPEEKPPVQDTPAVEPTQRPRPIMRRPASPAAQPDPETT